MDLKIGEAVLGFYENEWHAGVVHAWHGDCVEIRAETLWATVRPGSVSFLARLPLSDASAVGGLDHALRDRRMYATCHGPVSAILAEHGVAVVDVLLGTPAARKALGLAPEEKRMYPALIGDRVLFYSRRRTWRVGVVHDIAPTRNLNQWRIAVCPPFVRPDKPLREYIGPPRFWCHVDEDLYHPWADRLRRVNADLEALPRLSPREAYDRAAGLLWEAWLETDLRRPDLSDMLWRQDDEGAQ